MIDVIDNFLDYDYFEFLCDKVLTDETPWFFNECITRPGDNEYQFTHSVYGDLKSRSPLNDYFSQLYKKLEVNTLIRTKMNLNPRTETVQYSEPHVDFNDCITSIFYFNTNNGKTIFEGGTEVNQVANRLVRFDSNLKHYGASCTDEMNRILVNINYV